MKRILSFFLLSFAFINAFAQVPSGYYDPAAGLTGAPLKSALRLIIKEGHQDKGYSGLWTAYFTTDRDTTYENDGTIMDIYSENPTGPDPYNFTVGTNQCGQYSTEGQCYNREHIVPQSLFNEQFPMKSDIHFIRATDGKVNGIRSSYPFGKVGPNPSQTSQNGSKLGSSVSPGYSGTVFEPIDAFKGDVARMIFYFVTRYETQLAGFSSGDMLGGSAFPGLQQWELQQLLAWNAMDPVSPAETARNNAAYAFQGNRNPFIDNSAYADLIWGNLPVDNQAPTAATNLTTSNPTSNSISLSWTAATDNVGVTTYDIYVNGTLKTSVPGTSTTAVVSGLSPVTTYSFYIIARDASGNSSQQSNPATGVTLDGPSGGGNCGTENFSNIPTSTTPAYNTRVWTNNNITWTATDARIDQTINGKAITIRNGTLTSSVISGGIQNLTLTTQLKFTGNPGYLNVLINDVNVGTIPYSSTATTTTINNINISGNITIKFTNSSTEDRPALDDLMWTCYNGSLGTTETAKGKSDFTIYPNPVRNNELFVKGENLSKVSKAEIYDLSGKVIEVIANPFKNSNKINLKGLVKGTYILKTDHSSTKFIVE
ncbi:T9SS C-terminal target domain-containing protein [Chryseobacterium sp. G0186]|uniref:endonuclease n=1 Tax=Chryseobacterium sp. G0186 TaxID=2487064 RepID=UPI000F4DFA39|nr:endonuclease [Chryseobacterium sp. G0186]AZA79310.1 T9SS C-terminal target domain-containing protein [Chryseobacterium sp. G0186]